MKKSIVSQNEAQIGHILGIDFGKSKIGLAIADSETRMAFALGTFVNDGNFFTKLKEIIEENNVESVVMGMTSHAKDSESAKEKINFAEKIGKETGLSVMLQEEMFTTKMAQENMRERGRIASEADDQEAARIILQEWLDHNK
jgi:putative Holliday junction resolvase